jgi:AraC family transcriptional regulator of arabinose operon
MAYRIMQTPDLAIGLVQAARGAPPPRPRHWHGPYRWKTWVIDWCGYGGQLSEVAVRGEPLAPIERPARSWYIYAPGVAYRHFDERPVPAMESLWFFFELRSPWPLLRGRDLTVVVDDEERLTPHFHAMRELQHHGEPGYQLPLLAHGMVVLGEILAASQRGGDGSRQRPWRVRAPRGSAESLLHRLDREAMARPGRPPGIAALAERLAMSPSSLGHRFRAETGMSVMERVRWLRIREARRLLAEPEATVKGVARRLGFSSPFHLSRVFRAVTGVTARDYMARQRR